ncbi:thioredoxin family protein [Nonomuraea sp. 3N208]
MAAALAGRFEIMALPTLIVFVDGQPKKRLTGPHTKAELAES